MKITANYGILQYYTVLKWISWLQLHNTVHPLNEYLLINNIHTSRNHVIYTTSPGNTH
jgi:hypothetical protein